MVETLRSVNRFLKETMYESVWLNFGFTVHQEMQVAGTGKVSESGSQRSPTELHHCTHPYNQVSVYSHYCYLAHHSKVQLEWNSVIFQSACMCGVQARFTHHTLHCMAACIVLPLHKLQGDK